MKRIKRHAGVLLFFLVLSTGFLISPGIGPAWDEPDNMYSAGVYVNFFTHGLDRSYFTLGTTSASTFGDRIFANDNKLSHLPPVPNYVGLLFVYGANLLGIHTSAPVIITAFHWATVLFFALMVVMTYRFGLLLGLSFLPSLFAGLAVFLYPQLFGHGLSNLKDTAQVALVVTSLYFLVRATKDGAVHTKDLIIGAVVWGLGLATKFNAVYVPVIWGIWFVLQAKKHSILTIKYLFIVCIVGLITMFAVWPFLWFDSAARVVEVVQYFTTVGQGYRVIWDGVWYTVGTGTSLWWYPPASLLYTTPLFLLALFFSGCIVLTSHWKKKSVLIILPIWIVIPLIRTLSPWAAFYDLTRHFMEILPAIILIAAVGLEGLGTLGKFGRLVKAGIAIIILVQLICINFLYFPYSTGYYNVLARSPNTNFDRDIEALSVKDAVLYIHRTYGHARVHFSIGGHQSWYYLTPKDRYVYAQKDADIVVLVNKASHFRITDAAKALTGFTMVHEIRRGPAVFAQIYLKD